MNEGFPTLRRRRFPTIGGRAVREGAHRKDAGRRGYDHIWSKLSDRFRRKNPFCRFCEQQGRDATPADVTDHIIPVQDAPDMRLKWSNLQPLCDHCHNGLKRRLEEHARSTDQIDMLPRWCEEPETRPRKLGR